MRAFNKLSFIIDHTSLTVMYVCLQETGPFVTERSHQEMFQLANRVGKVVTTSCGVWLENIKPLSDMMLCTGL